MIEYLNLSLILITGIYASYTDIKKGIIKNHISWILIILGSAHQLFEVFQGTDLFLIIRNTILAFFIGYIFWEFGLWGPGDGKLYTGFALLIPYKVASIPVLTIIIITFVPFFIYYFLHSIIATKLSEIRKQIKTTFTLKSLLRSFVVTLTFIAIFNLIASNLPFRVDIFSSILLFYIFIMLYDAIKPNTLVTYIALGVTLLFALLKLNPIDLLIHSIPFFALIIVFRLLLLNLAFDKLTKKIKIAELKPGMLLAENIIEQNQTIYKRKNILFSFFEYIRRTKFEDISYKAITKSKIKNIKNLAKKHKGLTHIRIHETIPFAPFLTIGTILVFFL